MNRNYILLPILFISVLFVSCDFFDINNRGITQLPVITEPIYVPEIAWTLETDAYSSSVEKVIFDNKIYIVESNAYRNTLPKWLRILKVDAETGNVEWRSPVISGSESSSPIVCNNTVYINAYLNNNYRGILYCFNNENGTLKATIKLGIDDRDSSRNIIHRNMVTFNNYLIWPNFPKNDINGDPYPVGLVRFNTELIDYTQDPASEQAIAPEMFWNSPRGFGFLAQPVEHEGVIYFLTSNPGFWENEGYSELAAIDAVTMDVRWLVYQTVNRGNTKNPLLVEGERLFVIDVSPSSYDINTGDAQYETDVRKLDLKKDICLSNSFSSRGAFFHNNKIYYTTQASYSSSETTGIPQNLLFNIICIDALTGKFVWGDLVPDGASLFTRPVVINGRTYVVTDKGLRVYDSETGQLIGVDKTVKSYGTDYTLLYNNLIIYYNTDFTNKKEILTAIVAD